MEEGWGVCPKGVVSACTPCKIMMRARARARAHHEHRPGVGWLRGLVYLGLTKDSIMSSLLSPPKSSSATWLSAAGSMSPWALRFPPARKRLKENPKLFWLRVSRSSGLAFVGVEFKGF